MLQKTGKMDVLVGRNAEVRARANVITMFSTPPTAALAAIGGECLSILHCRCGKVTGRQAAKYLAMLRSLLSLR